MVAEQPNVKFQIDSNFTYTVYNSDGSVASESTTDNLIMTNGIDEIRKRIAGLSSLTISQVGIGNGTTTPAADNTDLVGTSKLWKNITTREDMTPASGDKFVSLGITIGRTEGNFAVNEIGLRFSDNTMVARSISDGTTKNSNQTATATWSLIIREIT